VYLESEDVRHTLFELHELCLLIPVNHQSAVGEAQANESPGKETLSCCDYHKAAILPGEGKSLFKPGPPGMTALHPLRRMQCKLLVETPSDHTYALSWAELSRLLGEKIPDAYYIICV